MALSVWGWTLRLGLGGGGWTAVSSAAGAVEEGVSLKGPVLLGRPLPFTLSGSLMSRIGNSSRRLRSSHQKEWKSSLKRTSISVSGKQRQQSVGAWNALLLHEPTAAVLMRTPTRVAGVRHVEERRKKPFSKEKRKCIALRRRRSWWPKWWPNWLVRN